MLKGLPFRYRYSTGNDQEPIDFCELALSNSISFDLGLGYFSSASFNILSVGFAKFISSGGKMRLYINEHLTEEDYKLLQQGGHIDFESRLLNSFSHLKETFSKRDEYFFKCLSFLIQEKRIDIKIAVPRNGGIAHEKFGLFYDEANNCVMFTGSMNLTASALLKNIETIDCTCSWSGQDSQNRIEASQIDFDRVWNGKNPGVIIVPAQKFCTEIIKQYPDVSEDNIIQQEHDIISSLKKYVVEDDVDTVASEPELPHFPKKYPTGPRPYQIDAYNAWVANDYKGIFAMATGTGKTITSLNCALNEFKKDCVYQILILVPTIALVDQWIAEASSFGFSKIITICSENQSWRDEAARLVGRLRGKRREDFVIISTYQSFTNKDFKPILKYLPAETLLIADEAHNIGAESVKRVFRTLQFTKRIALSATPNRIYDEEGTIEIEQYFNDKPPYVYRFSMGDAIQQGRLMEYLYYPKLAYLNDVEMAKYVKYTEQLMRLFDGKTNTFKDQKKAEKLLMDRKRIIHKSEDKLRVFRDILREIGEERLKYCFTYVPEGLRYKDADDFSDFDFHDPEDSVKIIDEMMGIVKEEFPNTVCSKYTGEISKKEREDLIHGFELGDIDMLFAMKCLDEGVDVPRAEYGIFTSSTGNPRQFIQRRGRLLRVHKDKRFATIYDIIVVPNYKSSIYSDRYWTMEKNCVASELSRVAYFSNLATNKISGALVELDDLAQYYGLNITEMIMSIENQ